MIPETHLLALLRGAWNQLATDYLAHPTDRSQNVLGAIFPTGTKIDDFDFYEQAAALLKLKAKMPGALRMGIGYVLDAQKVPSLHITLPGESTGGAPQGVGLDEAQGYRQPDGTLLVDDEYEPADDEKAVTAYSRYYQATYNLMHVAGSPMEASMLYHLWKGLLLAAHPSLELAGLVNLSVGGQELRLEQLQEQGAPDLFSRIVSLTFLYSHHVPALLQPEHAHRLIIVPEPLA